MDEYLTYYILHVVTVMLPMASGAPIQSLSGSSSRSSEYIFAFFEYYCIFGF